ncbi:MAG TPA: RDD family protein, partial [Candidatus Limnocylindrales bacterium]
MRDARREGSPYPKADLTLRALARAADLALASAIATAVPQLGPPIAAVYLLVADGLSNGQSIGKRIFGVRTIVLPPQGATRGAPAGYRESVLRNAAFALIALFFGIGVVGWLLVLLLGIPIVAFEAWMVWSDRLGIRIGDIFADTQVVD